jgi:hypothetical protein
MLQNLRNHKYLFIITVLFFASGFVNIHFALLGVICMTLPIVLLVRNQKKIWCQGYCPRASLFVTLGKVKKAKGRSTPQFFLKGSMKWYVLAYFAISLFFITISTIRVAGGAIAPMHYLRFLLFIPIPVQLPQLFVLNNIAPWITHLAYRFYSMMMTTTTFGLILAFVYKPRTWCTICPISTISDAYVNKIKKAS